MTFQNLLTDLRKRLELSVSDGTFTGTEIAGRVGVAQAHVSNFLNGHRGISPELADKFLTVLGLDVEALIAERSIRDRSPFEVSDHDDPCVVPVVSSKEALHPVIQQRFVQTVVYLPRNLAPEKKCKSRQHWTRLIGVENSLHEVLVIDRYLYNACPGRFAVMIDDAVQQGRLISDLHKTLFCPDDHSKPISISPIVIGRIVQIQC